MKLHVFTDCKSLFCVVRNEFIKTPTDKSTLHHAQWIRELVDVGSMCFHWADTRDMLADGLTKGKVNRILLQAAMQGSWTMQHKAESVPQKSLL